MAPTIAVAASIALVAYAFFAAPVVPASDGWRWIAQAMYLREGGFGALIRGAGLNHGDQIYALPSLIALALGPVFGYSFRPFAFIGTALVLAMAAVFYRLALREGLGPWQALVVFLSIASARHYSSLLHGFQFGIVLSMLAGVLAIVAAGQWRGPGGLAAAIVFALVAAASSSAGIFAAAVVVAMRAHRRVAAAVVAVAIVAAFLYAVHRLRITPRSVWSDSLVELGVADIARSVIDWTKVVGGGLVGGGAATIVGLVVIVIAVDAVIGSLARERKLDTLSGLAVFSMATTFAIAIVRFHDELPASRHAIAASPLIGVAVIDLLRRRSAWFRSLAARCAVVVALLWLQAEAMDEALAYRKTLVTADRDVRLVLARTQTSDPPSDVELATISPARPAFVRRLVELVRDERWMIFDPRNPGVVASDALPALSAGGARAVDAQRGSLEFVGPGYYHDRVACSFAAGCVVRVSADVATTGASTVGIIVRNADGTEVDNRFVGVPRDGNPSPQSVRVDAAIGQTLEPYVFAWTANDRVTVRRFGYVMIAAQTRP